VPEAARRDDIIFQEIGGEAVLIDPIAGRSHVINGTAARIWNQLDGSTPPQAIAHRLADEYDVEATTARADVDRITSSFDTLGLLQR
jgi:hypothetical protein